MWINERVVHQIRTLLLVMTAAIVLACGSTPKAPAGFNDPVCSAFRLVAGTGDDWRKVSAAIGDGDLLTADAVLTDLEPTLRDAVRLAGDAESWAPGDAFALEVQTAAGDFIASIRAFRNQDYATATDALSSGNRHVNAATAALPAMKTAGLSC